MAAKLKKRALAEYAEVADPPKIETPAPTAAPTAMSLDLDQANCSPLKRPKKRSPSPPSSQAAPDLGLPKAQWEPLEGRGGGPSTQIESKKKRLRHLMLLAAEGPSRLPTTAIVPLAESCFPLAQLSTEKEITALLVQTMPSLRRRSREELLELAQIVWQVVQQHLNQDDVCARLLLFMEHLLSQGSNSEDVRLWIREHLPDWVAQVDHMSSEEAFVGESLKFWSHFHLYKIPLSGALCQHITDLTASKIKTRSVRVQVACLQMWGQCVRQSANPDVNRRIHTLAGKYGQSQEPRVRKEAFQVLLELVRGFPQKFSHSVYKSVVSALKDDYEGVRIVALNLIYAIAKAHPQETFRENKLERRLVDDAFGHICNTINDLSIKVREKAAELMGLMNFVSQNFLEQTLDKKLMSNLRAKRTAHERESKLVSSGEWSSGKKWGDDAPKEELDASSVSVMALGACGAFVHGLEDEFLAVRSMSISSLTQLSVKNPRLASMALDFLVDMFNDEIELVRLKAIESLRLIASHISLQAHQLEVILTALDDYSILIRERLHSMLQSSNLATKDGLQRVIQKLLDNLKKYPHDRRSIFATFKNLGERHSELTLPLVPQLLEIHPFFDTAEPDLEEPSYLCILILVYNASARCPTMEPLLDCHTKRHFLYLVDTYPHLTPKKENQLAHRSGRDLEVTAAQTKGNTEIFLHKVASQVTDSEHMNMPNRIKLLSRACSDLKRLGSFEPSVAHRAKFLHLYVECQVLILKCLATRFWTNSMIMSQQEKAVIESMIAQLYSNTLQLQYRFSNLTLPQRKKVLLLKIHVLSLHALFIVLASNKSALAVTEDFFHEVEVMISTLDSPEEVDESPFLAALLAALSSTDDHKPGSVVKIVQPLLLSHPVEACQLGEQPISMSHAVIFEPLGMNETPLKYLAGMILSVPVDCEIYHAPNPGAVRIAIKTPDQKIQLVTPKSSQFIPKDHEINCYRLLTDALMSHNQVWSEALHVDVGVVLDLSALSGVKTNLMRKASTSLVDERRLIPLCDPVKVYVLPKAVKRGI
ncbi:integrator complex subunit 4-like [Tigriopus californicus]|uniref:integrator complex subunit 4-like n=1 Tax=Tigriopus californicus TaxID=6832 RepID=UPI0027DA62AE|nr:integrator complex subunit 4-like [Tigriopus californicus]